MPFVNGKFYMNPAYGRAIENARASESTDGDQGGHWVTIDGHHVLIQEVVRRNIRLRSRFHTQDTLVFTPIHLKEKRLQMGKHSNRMDTQRHSFRALGGTLCGSEHVLKSNMTARAW